MKQELITLNKAFVQNDFYGDLNNPDVFSYFDKGTYVCLSAPHTTKTVVNGNLKISDLYTGAITKYISEQNNFSYIVRNKHISAPVWISDFILENKIENHFFLDIHAMKNGNGFDLAIGTGFLPAKQYKTQLEYIDKLAKKYGIKYVVNDANYTGQIGLTGKLQKAINRTNVLQLEWCKDLRDIFNCFDNVKNKTIPFITELAQFIESENK